VFAKVAGGQFDKDTMVSQLAHAGDEHRVLIWSAKKQEQSVLAQTSLAGPLAADDRRFGVFLNDATGAKMDYYLHTGVGVGQAACGSDGRARYLVRLTLTSDAPKDAATSLPWYVTGGGLSGVPAGETDTTVSVYAPTGAIAVGAKHDGSDVAIRRATDHGRSVAQALIKLRPGQSVTYEFEFLGAVGTASAAKGDAAAPGAVVTPGVWPTSVKPVSLNCADIS
jgi:hypothetical protein